MNARLNRVNLGITNRNMLKEESLTRWDVVLVSGVWYEYAQVSQLVFKLRMACHANRSVLVGDPSGTIKYFADEREMQTVSEYQLNEYTFKLQGFKETEVLKFKRYVSKEDEFIEKYKYLINDLNMSMFE